MQDKDETIFNNDESTLFQSEKTSETSTKTDEGTLFTVKIDDVKDKDKFNLKDETVAWQQGDILEDFYIQF